MIINCARILEGVIEEEEEKWIGKGIVETNNEHTPTSQVRRRVATANMENKRLGLY